MPERPSSERHLKRYELMLALAGLTVTILLGYNQNRLTDRQNELQKQITLQQQALQERLTKQQQEFEQRLAAQQNVLQIMAVVKDYLPLMDDTGPKGQKAITIISAAATQMSVKYNDQFLADLAKAILEAPKSSEAATLQIAEATVPVPPQSANSRACFTVLASYTLFNLREAQAERRRIEELQSEYPVEVYKTKASNHYALTIGGRLTRSEALRLARVARERGWSSDAFAQLDREWDMVGEAGRQENRITPASTGRPASPPAR